MTRKALRNLALLSVIAFAFCSAKIASAQTPPPVLFFSDLDSGPNGGGESVSGFAGPYVTLYGNNLGSSQGSSTVTWNGINCLRVVGPVGTYSGWGTPYFWYQKLIVQLGSGCTPGTGNFVVTVGGQASAGLPFTVRSTGRIFFVATTGNDASPGTFASPFRSIVACKNAVSNGDTCYIGDGVNQTTQDSYDATLQFTSGGIAGQPRAFVAYPGATVNVGSNSLTYGIRVPNVGSPANYLTFAGLRMSIASIAMSPTSGSDHWRIVANHFECPTANGQNGCFTSNETTNIKFFGNEATNIGVPAASKQQHAVYFSSDVNHVEAGWNWIHNNRSCRAMQFHSSPLGGGGATDVTGHNQFDLSAHDNLIHDDPCSGINFATVDPSQGKVEAYNNVMFHVGIGPDPYDGQSGDYSCIRIAQITNTGPLGTGFVEIYNNTFSDCGSHSGTFGANGVFELNPGGIGAILRNNIIYQNAGESYANGGGSVSGIVISGLNNIWFGSSQAIPTFTTNNIKSDPLFVNRAANDFRLTGSSPARDAGITINSSNSYLGRQVWNGNPLDHDGVSRPQGSAFDIGAYEYFSGGTVVQKPNPPTNLSVSVQ